MNKTILVVGSRQDFDFFLSDKENKKDYVYLDVELTSLRGLNLKDVIFLENWYAIYPDKLEMLKWIICCFRGTGFNVQTYEGLKILYTEELKVLAERGNKLKFNELKSINGVK
jgi:hypothetical protein